MALKRIIDTDELPVWEDVFPVAFQQDLHSFAVGVCRVAATLPSRYTAISDRLQNAAISMLSYAARAYMYDPEADQSVNLKSGKSCIAEIGMCIRLICDLDLIERERFLELMAQQNCLNTSFRSLLSAYNWPEK